MEAKDNEIRAIDTVMGEDEKLGCSLVSPLLFKDVKDVIDETCIHQAEITWQARDPEIIEAHKAGIKEVVEWIKRKRETPIGTDPYGYYIWEGDLLNQLKEWGV